MTHPNRRTALRTTLALATAGLLPPARACEFFAGNLKVVHPWTRATAPDADEAAVSMVFDDVTAADRLVGLSTPVATRAEMAGIGLLGATDGVHFDIPAGQSSALMETGVHVRLRGLTGPLEVARAYPMTLTFQHAGMLKVLLTVDYERFR